MREVIGLGQLRSNACNYLERVVARETIDVIRRGKLVARMVSPGDWGPDSGGRVGLDELRKRAGRCFDKVQAGQTIEVIRGGAPVARIVSA
jgi:antitoxin (DNA-binding transcriptional repressor) of toxin-antitoxin stability system